MVRKSAFTLIELIFAIVIIAISVVSLPMMNQAISKGVDANLVQEAIFAAATELNEAVTASWDENSIEPGTNFYARVIDHSGNCATDTRLMPGHINEKLHRRCLDSNTTTPADANSTTLIDLDEMAHGTRNIFIDNTTDATGYKKKYFSEVEVNRGAVFAGSANQNMKSVTITIKDEDDVTLVSLTTYVTNIGEIDYHKRAY
ncbi:MAG: type II secretion system protein [Campylobacterota bacterium]|nr:type II secretion system protein [Campylobacterota bacterium]